MSSIASEPAKPATGHIYLIREREFVNADQPVYKIGKSGQQGLKRAKQYPKDSVIEIHLRVDDHHSAEVALIKSFKILFKHRPDIGAEYFEANRNAMVAEICKYNQIVTADAKVEQPAVAMVIDQSAAINMLGQLFYSIYYGIRYAMGNYTDHSMRNIYASHCVNRLYETQGQPILRPDEPETIIDLDKVLGDLAKLFAKPSKSKMVSSMQFQYYVGWHNTISRLIGPVATYNLARSKMETPAKYIGIKLKGPLAEIDMIAFNLMIQKCHDWKQNGQSYSWFPRCG